MTSQRVYRLNQVFGHTLSEKQSKQQMGGFIILYIFGKRSHRPLKTKDGLFWIKIDAKSLLKSPEMVLCKSSWVNSCFLTMRVAFSSSSAEMPKETDV